MDNRSETDLVVAPNDTEQETLRLLTTRLNNPTTGIKIYEEGVDPEPVVADEDSENTDDEDETNTAEDTTETDEDSHEDA